MLLPLSIHLVCRYCDALLSSYSCVVCDLYIACNIPTYCEIYVIGMPAKNDYSFLAYRCLHDMSQYEISFQTRH